MDKATVRNREILLKALKKEKFPNAIVNAFATVPQENFFDQGFRSLWYTGKPVPIGLGEYSDATLDLLRMFRRLEPNKKWKVLEVGTGSGYSTALLSHLVKEVITVEWKEELAASAKCSIQASGVTNVRIFCGDGTLYEKALGLFDAVVIMAACRKRPLSLTRQIKAGGRIAFPMGTPTQQQITIMVNNAPDNLDTDEEFFTTRFFEFCEFYPARGRYGWDQVISDSSSE